MSAKMIELELNEHMFAALWKYVKCILRFHVQGFLVESKAT
jgi:hypothetical protein